MAKVQLSALVNPNELVDAADEATPPALEVAPTPKPAPKAPPARTTATRKARQPRQEPAVPKYQRLERKETRLTVEQYESLTTVARKLNRRKRMATPGEAVGERITENTLIRVAVDLLLSRVDELDGVDEDELRKSVGL